MIRNVQALADGAFDIVVIGGGITGAGVALDAALRGFRVAVIDKGDFASGTSSVSSKLIHGGLRYLEQGELGLVYQALHERQRLLRNAPHVVRPLPFVLPIYQESRLSLWRARTGLVLYDLLAGSRNLRRSRPLSVQQLQRSCPELKPQSLIGAAAYFDAQMDDARLCIEVVKSASKVGAAVANYVEAMGFERQAGVLTGVRVRDNVSAAELTLRTRQVVNATGPWSAETCRLAGEPGLLKLRPTKGVHLIVPDRGLRQAILLLHPADGRVFFVIPWQGKTLIGTTDTPCQSSPDALTVEESDIDYLLQGHNHYFRRPVERSHLVNTFVGLRPLVNDRDKSPSRLSREFRIVSGPSGLLTVAGGKYTTYRHMAEEVVNVIAGRLGRGRWTRTRKFLLEGAPSTAWNLFREQEPARLHCEYGLQMPVARHLVERYGQCAAKVAEQIRKDESLAQPIVADEPDIRAELAYQRLHEMAIFPADSLLRRTRVGLFHPALLGRNWNEL